MSYEEGKRRAAEAAAKLVMRGMTLGLGTGSTANYFIDALAEKTAAGWPLRGVPTSPETRTRAAAIGIEMIEADETTTIDLAVDGADEADPDRNLIKGGGGALLREKIVANAAAQFVVIADTSKRVAHLGAFPLPVEIDPFSYGASVKQVRLALKAAGYESPELKLRTQPGGMAFKTAGGHLIVDCALGKIAAPAALDQSLRAIPGVIETGLFCGLADLVIYGDENGVSVDGATPTQLS